MLGFDAEHETRQYRLTCHQHGTGTALAELATVLRAGEVQILAQDFQQGRVDLCGDLASFAVDAKTQQGFGWSGIVSGFFNHAVQILL
jgi:hypothetical protein